MSTERQPETDPFDTLLTLEDTLYTTAYSQGAADGARAGRIEGRIFGLEKGFEKFASMGILHGRACVWASRLPPSTHPNQEAQEAPKTVLPVLSAAASNPRLAKNIGLLHGLTDPLTFDTANTEEAVADFDDRFKRAGAKAKIIERTIGENLDAASPDGESSSSSKKGVGRRVKVSGESKKDDSLEDFVASPRLLA